MRPQGDKQSSRAYKIEDSDGVTLFTATGRKFSVRACREFWDASGLPLFELHRKMSLKNTWSVTLPGSKHANIATASAGWSVGDFKITFQNRAAVESKKEEEKILTLEVEKYGNALASFDVVDGDRKVAEIRESIPHNEKLALLPSSKKGYRPVLDVTVLPGVDLSLVRHVIHIPRVPGLTLPTDRNHYSYGVGLGF